MVHRNCFNVNPGPQSTPRIQNFTDPDQLDVINSELTFLFQKTADCRLMIFVDRFFSTKAIQDILEARDGIGHSGGQAL